jgi:nitrite reductase/ring-hydroxylating ferredoxin subunit
MPFDIEDFGVVLSAGITCPKHGWSFDLFTGNADRASYRLKVWEVQLRDVPGLAAQDVSEGEAPPPDKEVWVRRKQRIG